MWNRFIKQFIKIASTLPVELIVEPKKKKTFTSEMELATASCNGRYT